MDVIFALESVRVGLPIFDALDLKSRVEEPIFSAEKIGHLRHGLEWFDGLEVAGHGDLADGNSPNVQVVNSVQVVAALSLDVPPYTLHIDVTGCTFHQGQDHTIEGGDRDTEDDHGIDADVK